jgi:hypothetical protein
MKPMNTLVCLSFLIICTITAVQAQVHLAYRMTPGETVRYCTVMSMEYSASAMGQDIAMTAKGNSQIHMTCDSAAPERITCTMTLDTGTMTTDMPAELRAMVQMDSVMPLSKYQPKRTRIAFTPTGKILSSEVLDSNCKIKSMMKAFSMDAEKLNEMFGSLPAGVVAPGATWMAESKDSADMSGMGMMYITTKTNYTFQRFLDTLRHHCAVISAVSTIGVEGAVTGQGLTLAASGGGKAGGTYYFDPDKGVFIASIMRVESTTNIAITGSGEENMVMPQTTSSTTEMSIME